MKTYNRKAFTLIELLVVIAIIAILAAILFPVFTQAKNAAKSIVTVSNMKQVALGGILYSDSNDDVNLPHQLCINNGPGFNASCGTPDAGYYFYLEPYLKSKAIIFDNARGIPVDTSTGNAWTLVPSISINRNGWSSWETLGTFVRAFRTAGSQEKIAERAAYIITAQTANQKVGYNFTSDEAYCPVVVNPNTVSNSRFQRAYLAAKFHRERLVTGYGDGHAGSVPSGKVMKFNQTVAEANECAGYNNSQFISSQIKTEFWGTWYSPTE
ncbi:MAG: prepilin-type N-terminal cleavage/methylation domain-containing protein [Armatimonadetes bacterium]|nr:prepilin-type N-terminal cleavage/methylation domain-containing protein [Armatimonadota bacterium]